MAETKKSGWQATHRYARISARKARLVIDAVRGMPVNDALVRLRHIRRRASPMVEKVIRSAMANAQQEGNVDLDRLRVAEAYCNEGPTLKRWRPRAMGRVYPVMKRTSHIRVVLREIEEQA
jgi:large subunit ribosomal protein L22